MDESLQRFVHDALTRDIPRNEIEATLKTAGWSNDEIQNALGLYAEVEFPIPVPQPQPYLSAREAFVYLVMFTMLYLSSWSLGSVLFDFINRALPDPIRGVSAGTFALSRLRWSVATLLISFPIYLLLSNRTYRAARRDPERRKSRVRKWLTYLTLFLAASVLVGDLITLVFNLLEGELTIRFILKVLVVAAISGAVFGFYLWDLKQDDQAAEEPLKKHPWLKGFTSAVTIAVSMALIGGLYNAGSPGSARKRALDQQREQNLAAIANGVDGFWRREGRLPNDLAELVSSRGIRLQSITDPASDRDYDYRIISEATFELCAVFDTASIPTARRQPVLRGKMSSKERFWEHPGGKTCFSIEARDFD